MIVLVCNKKKREKKIKLSIYLVCDIIRSQDIPAGIRQTLVPIETYKQRDSDDSYKLINDDGKLICFLKI